MPNRVKDWAVGSFYKYQDRPYQIFGVQKTANPNLENLEMNSQQKFSQRVYLIDWKIRPDGFKPLKCFITEDELLEADQDMLIEFLEKQL